MTDPGPGGGGPDPRLRAVAVVGLLCVAAVALQARQGLDWGQLAEPVEVRWARVLLGSVLLLVLVVTARRMLRRLRRRRPPPGPDDDHADPEGEPFPWFLRVLAAALVLAALGAAFYVVSALGPPTQPPRPRPDLTTGQTGTGSSAPGGPDTRTSWTVLVVVGLVLAGSALVSRWAASRGRDRSGEGDLEDEQRDEVDLLLAAVDAADEGLQHHADPRAAVLAAYAAMAGQLSGGLARRGRAARRSDTATELLDRAVAAGLVDGAPARTLTELFREARFSEHPMGEDARRSALDCLARVRTELAARRD